MCYFESRRLQSCCEIVAWLLFLLATFLGLISPVSSDKFLCNQPASSAETIYKFGATDINKSRNISFSEYQGKVVLVTNVATFWGLTAVHYIGSNALKSQYQSKGFEVLAFPCNIFGKLEPESNGTEILHALQYVRPGNGFEPNFQMMEMVDVNGKNEHPLFTYLKKYCPPTSDEFEDGLFYSPLRVNDVRWNYEQFLVDRTGKIRMRYHHHTDPSALAGDIDSLLREGEPEIEMSNEIPTHRLH